LLQCIPMVPLNYTLAIRVIVRAFYSLPCPPASNEVNTVLL